MSVIPSVPSICFFSSCLAVLRYLGNVFLTLQSGGEVSEMYRTLALLGILLVTSRRRYGFPWERSSHRQGGPVYENGPKHVSFGSPPSG